MSDTGTTNSLDVKIEYKIGDKVNIKWGEIEFEILGYEYVPPTIKYVILNPDGNRKYCLPIEIEPVKENKFISFIKM